MNKFEVGKTYSMRSPCDHNCIWSYEVTKRTDKTITIKARDGEIKNCRVKAWSYGETCKPIGSFSMCPVLSA